LRGNLPTHVDYGRDIFQRRRPQDRCFDRPRPWNCVKFARISVKRGISPTPVPVREGGSPVRTAILLLNLAEQESTECVWRREINKGGRDVARTLRIAINHSRTSNLPYFL
jgi:hypothetical protein